MLKTFSERLDLSMLNLLLQWNRSGWMRTIQTVNVCFLFTVSTLEQILGGIFKEPQIFRTVEKQLEGSIKNEWSIF